MEKRCKELFDVLSPSDHSQFTFLFLSDNDCGMLSPRVYNFAHTADESGTKVRAAAVQGELFQINACFRKISVQMLNPLSTYRGTD